MGKKDKNQKKGKGAEKTAMKTDKKLVAKQKKLIAKLGEDDIESVVAKYELKDNKSSILTETICAPPSARVNFSICSHPDKEELFIHGGEFYNGQKTVVHGEFYCYSIVKNDWKELKATNSPAPRSGHQMVSVSTDGGQIWLFGGEYASPSQLQFYHYKDMWVFRIAKKQWEKINASNGPTARSGHRMVASKKNIFVFGGFHDNNSSYRYFNDLYAFSLENYTWSKIETKGVAPAPRSGCCMVANSEGKILIWGGYSKSSVKKEIDRGTTHVDMFSLTVDKNDPSSYKWTSIKPGGRKPPPRSGMSAAIASNGKVFTFGGVMDTEEDEEDVRGTFSNELYLLETSSHTWRKPELACKMKSTKKVQNTDSTMDTKMETELKTVVSDDGIFTMSVGGPSKDVSVGQNDGDKLDLPGPSPRMNAGLAVCKGNLYVYGGLYESGSRQYTLSDFYSLDAHKLDQWKTLIANSSTEWLGSDSEEGSSDDDDDDDDDSDDSSENNTDDSSSDMDTD
ncbi:kelch domain-containing protein 4 [Sabethes cyaneus]|uniref:kelch domain-containing protein 4 n=1 Tax=Sabethes cyaneus TaxID=53552 RepID=UPI00237DDF45|nr:kelch domain-containing protein 4 [Sabethes cyaneus]